MPTLDLRVGICSLLSGWIYVERGIPPCLGEKWYQKYPAGFVLKDPGCSGYPKNVGLLESHPQIRQVPCGSGSPFVFGKGVIG